MAVQGEIRTVRRRRLYEDIVQQFHSMIRQRALPHGARLPSERLLAEQFGVSRSSVREAIRSLELQGLVVSKRGSGTFINSENLDSVVALIAGTLSPEDDTLRDVFEVRHLLEPQIAAVAAQRAEDSEICRLGEILEQQQREIEAGETGVNADTAFHFALASATHNSALVKVVSAVEDMLERSRDQSLQEPGRPQRSLASHRHILETVRARHSEAARQAMEHHLTAVEPAVLSNPQPSNQHPGSDLPGRAPTLVTQQDHYRT
jgi:GntR family transcriptional repressor for pyruvate dehydrogenase complex